MPKLTSEIWKYFNKVDEKHVECKKCGKSLSDCGNTTNFWNHLAIHKIKRPQTAKNPSKNPDFHSEPGASTSTQDGSSETNNAKEFTTPSQARVKRKLSNPDSSAKQKTLEATYKRLRTFEDGGARESELNQALLFMVCKDLLPLQTPENAGFKYFSKVAVPLWKPPSRRTLTRMCEAKYETLKAAVCEVISNLPSMSLTFDAWTETHTTQSYLGGTLHFLSDFEMETCNLSITALDETHSSEYLSEVFSQICNDWKIDISKVALVVTDNAANITKAAKETFPTTVTCFDHTLNLIPQYAIGYKPHKPADAQKVAYVPGVPELIQKVKQIVTYMNHCVNASDELKKEQMKDGKTAGTILSLPQECPTRWSSCYFMIVRILELSETLGIVLLKHPKATMLTGAEIAKLRNIAKILQPLQTATTDMSADKTTTVSKVIPMVHLMRKEINNCDVEDDELAIRFRRYILSELDRRFDQVEFVRPFAVATVLDPRFKKIYFQSSLAVSKAIKFITEEMKKNAKEAENSSPPKPEKRPTEGAKNSIWASHDEHVKSQAQYSTEDSAGGLPIELRQYLNRPVLSIETNPFKAWDSMKIEYPNLHKLAIKYLPLTATSVPSERLFSQAKLVLTDLRSRLTSTHASQLLFLGLLSDKIWMKNAT